MKFSIVENFMIIVIILNASFVPSFGQSKDEKEAMDLMEVLNREFIEERFKSATVEWNYASNMTNETLNMKTIGQRAYAVFRETKADELMQFDFKSFKNESLKRQMKKLTNLGDSLLNDESFIAIKTAIASMQEVYAKTKIPSYQNESEMLDLEPEITEIIQTSRDPEEMKYYWTQWHDKVGTNNKDAFFKYAEYRNEAAKLNGFPSGAEMWLNDYEDPSFEKQIEDILEQIMPLYKQLHGYVRYKLNKVYGDDVVNITQPIPMHLLGNMWGQQWNTVAELVVPYPDKQTLDVTEEMLRQNYTQLKMFQMGDEFFTSLNMTKLPESFWKNSIIEKPNDGRELICHASAWDFIVENNVRIKQCTRVDMDNFIIVHHELGHIQYYLQYQNQSIAFRGGANPGFHEAVGDVLALSVATPKHLEKIGLLKNFTYDKESQLNQFVRMGMAKLSFLPFAYTMDKFRWGVFRGEITPENGNCEFWKFRVQHGGVEPAIVRTNDDFDITAKYHAAADVEYLRYFVSFITQFQFYKSACILAGQYEEGSDVKPLNDCDIFENTKAGNAIKAMLSLGSSKPWPDAMEVMTGQRKMDAKPLLEYFKPLDDWLVKENKKLGVHIGWEETDKLKCDEFPPMDSMDSMEFPEFPKFPDFPL